MACRSRRILRAEFTLLLVVGLAACAQGGATSASSSPPEPAPGAPIAVEAATPSPGPARDLAPLPTVP